MRLVTSGSIKLACPQELQFKEDSLSIVKANSIIEKYKIKWKDNELLLHNNVTVLVESNLA